MGLDIIIGNLGWGLDLAKVRRQQRPFGLNM